MIRIFDPATPNPVLRRDGISAGVLVLHLVAVILMVSPPTDAPSREELLDRLVVFLVPPDEPGPREPTEGTSAWSVAPSDGADGGAAAISSEDAIEKRGEVPALTAAVLELTRLDDPAEGALTELEVDSAVVRDPTSAAPEYPAHLLSSGLEGHAEVRYVVDTLGAVDTLSYRVVKASHVDFAVAVRRALPRMRFQPAIVGGRRVRQLVEQTFRFKINPATEASVPPIGPAAPRTAPRP